MAKKKKQNFNKWTQQKIKKLDWFDIGLVKLSTGAFFLMIAKLWSPLLSLDWYWYLVIAIVLALRPIHRVYINHSKK